MADIARMYYKKYYTKTDNENAITHFYNLAQTKL